MFWDLSRSTYEILENFSEKISRVTSHSNMRWHEEGDLCFQESQGLLISSRWPLTRSQPASAFQYQELHLSFPLATSSPSSHNIFRAPCMLVVHYWSGCCMELIFSKESRFPFSLLLGNAIRGWSPQTQRGQRKSKWRSLATPPGATGWAPWLTAGEQPAPVAILAGAHWPRILTQTTGLRPTETWGSFRWEEPFVLALDLLWDVQGKNREGSWWFEEEWAWRRHKHRQKRG